MVYIDGQKVDIRNPMDSLNLGQSIIFQEFNLIDALSIAENIYLGRLSRKKGKPIDWKQVNAQAKALMREVGYDIDPRMLIRDLSVAQKQMVEIAKALSFNARIIMDEPSAIQAATSSYSTSRRAASTWAPRRKSTISSTSSSTRASPSSSSPPTCRNCWR